MRSGNCSKTYFVCFSLSVCGTISSMGMLVLLTFKIAIVYSSFTGGSGDSMLLLMMMVMINFNIYCNCKYVYNHFTTCHCPCAGFVWEGIW